MNETPPAGYLHVSLPSCAARGQGGDGRGGGTASTGNEFGALVAHRNLSRSRDYRAVQALIAHTEYPVISGSPTMEELRVTSGVT